MGQHLPLQSKVKYPDALDDAPLDERAEWMFNDMWARASRHGFPHIFKERGFLCPLERVAERLNSEFDRFVWELLIERRRLKAALGQLATAALERKTVKP